jgi:hypothetical protein
MDEAAIWKRALELGQNNQHLWRMRQYPHPDESLEDDMGMRVMLANWCSYSSAALSRDCLLTNSIPDRLGWKER